MAEFGPIVVKLNHCWIHFPYYFLENHFKKSWTKISLNRMFLQFQFCEYL